MNITSLILVVSVYPFVPLMYFLLKNSAAPKKGMYYGVKLDKEQRKAPEVEQITRDYGKQMKQSFFVMMLAPIPIVFIPWFSIMLTCWMILLVASCFVFFVPFGIANKRLKELKLQKGWKANQEQSVYVEMKDAGRLRRVKWYHFLPQSVLSLGIFAWALIAYQGPGATVRNILLGSFASVTLLFWLVAVWMDRQKTQIISMDSDVNINYNRAKKNLWKNFWVICAWINIAYIVCMLFALDQSGRFTSVFWAATALYTLLPIVLLLWLIKKKSTLDSRYLDKIDAVLPDDEDNWIWGMIYYNPKDKHSMVEKRVGTGTSVNMATPVGKGFAIFGGLSLLSLPLICIWVILLEFTPIQLAVKDNQVVASHLKEDFAISISSIQNVELLTGLPKMSRNHGTSMDTLKKGSFRVSEEGSCEVFLNPQNELFIRIEALGETYYFSGRDDEETRQVYEALK